MQLTVNGEKTEVSEGANIDSLLQFLGVTSGQVAVECNLAIVPKSQYGSVTLAEGDSIEIVRFIGGG